MEFCSPNPYSPRPKETINEPHPRNAYASYLLISAHALSGPLRSSVSSTRLIINSLPVSPWIAPEIWSVAKGTPHGFGSFFDHLMMDIAGPQSSTAMVSPVAAIYSDVRGSWRRVFHVPSDFRPAGVAGVGFSFIFKPGWQSFDS